MAFDYVTVDVFTDTRFGGNPLAVFPDARGIDDVTMQRLAVEFNYSEITFVLPPQDSDHTARVRIFTPAQEVPFAGHPNVGTGFVLGRQGVVFGKSVGDTMIFEEKSGLVEVKLLRRGGEVVESSIAAPNPLHVGGEVDLETLSACTSLKTEDFNVSVHRPHFVSVGLQFVVAQLDGLKTLASVRPNVTAYSEAKKKYPQPDGRFSIFLYVRTASGIDRLRARMFATDTHEDPATGSASGALAAYLAHIDPRRDMNSRIVIEQGVEMGRHSTISLDVRKSKNCIDRVSVSGQCVPVMRGTIEL